MGSFAKDAVRVVLVAAAFAAVSWYAREHQEALAAVIAAGGAAGPAAFVLFTAAFVIFVIPLDLVLLVPLGVALWGPVATALLSVIGWTVGASVAFTVARRYGRPLVAWLVGSETIARLEARVPVANSFWSVMLLRMCIPVDVLSYALGLFGTISWGRYIAATALGVAPFGFYFAFVGTLPLWWELGAVALAFAVVSLALLIRARTGR